MADDAIVRDQVERIFSEQLHPENPSAETDLIETGVLNSLKFVEFLLHVEQQLGVTISLDELDIENFRSIKRIMEFLVLHNGVERRQAGSIRSVPG